MEISRESRHSSETQIVQRGSGVWLQSPTHELTGVSDGSRIRSNTSVLRPAAAPSGLALRSTLHQSTIHALWRQAPILPAHLTAPSPPLSALRMEQMNKEPTCPISEKAQSALRVLRLFVLPLGYLGQIVVVFQFSSFQILFMDRHLSQELPVPTSSLFQGASFSFDVGSAHSTKKPTLPPTVCSSLLVGALFSLCS